jgi:eukaryotic-like serine/threonine-protein kinase
MQEYSCEKRMPGTARQVVDSRYGLIERLGSGGMAEVYLAHDQLLDRDVALKVLRRRYANDETFVERFRREAYSAAALSHPNIVPIFDRGESNNGTYYIAMEYLPGGTLKDRIRRKGYLLPHVAAAVAAQIAEALDAAHRHGVVHRDVKPENILITASGDVKVTDFGIARAASSVKMTHSGIFLGTVRYVSPEQAMGEPAGPRSDLYSLGVVLYEMLTGEPPYDADSPLGIAMKHVNGHLRSPQEIDPSIPEEINDITVRLLATDPEGRYPDAASLLDDLYRAEQGLAPAEATTQALFRPAIRARGSGLPNTWTGVVKGLSSTPPSWDASHRKRWRRRIFFRALVGSLLAALTLTGATVSILGQHFWERDDVPVLDVPSLVGMSLGEARSEAGSDFNLRAQVQKSDEPVGTILSQDLKNGEKAEKGMTIGVVISRGEESLKIPDVRGQDPQEAFRTLQDAGMTVSREYKQAKSVKPKDTVIGTDPPSGSKVEVGTPVTLILSSGTPEGMTAPSSIQQPAHIPVLSSDPASWVAPQEPAMEQSAAEQPAMQETAVQEPTTTEQPPGKQSVVQGPAMEQRPVERKSITEDGEQKGSGAGSREGLGGSEGGYTSFLNSGGA